MRLFPKILYSLIAVMMLIMGNGVYAEEIEEDEEETTVEQEGEGHSLEDVDLSSLKLRIVCDDESVLEDNQYIIHKEDNEYILEYPSLEEIQHDYLLYLDKVLKIEPYTQPEQDLEEPVVEEVEEEIKEELEPIESIAPPLMMAPMLKASGGFSVEYATQERFNELNALKFSDGSQTYRDLKVSGVSVTQYHHSDIGHYFIETRASQGGYVEITYDKVGTYKGDDISARVRYDFIEGGDAFGIGEYFEGGYKYGQGIKRLRITYSYFLTDDPEETKLYLENAFMSCNSLNGTSDSAEWATYLGMPRKAIIVNNTYLQQRNVAGNEVFAGTSESFTDYITGSTFNRAAVVFEISGTDIVFEVGHNNRIWGVWNTPSTYALGYNLPDYKKTYNITTEVINGSIDPDIHEIEEGDTKTINYQANPDHFLDYIEVDGVKVDNLDSVHDNYTFSNITEDHHIKVVYVPLPPITKIALSRNGEDYTRGMVKAGEIRTYQISVANPASTSKLFTIVDELPDGLEFQSASHQGVHDSQKVTWSINIEPSESITVEVKALVKEEAKDSVLINKASYTVEGVGKDTDIEIPVLKNPVKTVKNSAGKDMDGVLVPVDYQLIYVIEVKNSSNDTKTFTVKDKIDGNLQFIEADQDGTFSDSTITWVKEIEAGKTETFTFIAKTTREKAYIPNRATVYVDEISDDTNLVENWTPVPPIKHVYQNDKEVNGKIVEAGSQLKYEITVENNTNREKLFTIKDKLPTNTENVHVDNGEFKDGRAIWYVKVPANSKKTVIWTVRTVGNGVKIENIATASIDEVIDVSSNKVINETTILVNSLAYNPKDGTSNIKREKNAEIKDIIYYDKAEPGAWYEVVGTLHKIDEKGWDMGELYKDGQLVYVSKWFQAPSEKGQVEIAYSVDSSDLKGMTLNSYVRVMKGSQVAGNHASPAHESQNIYVDNQAYRIKRVHWIKTNAGRNTILYSSLALVSLLLFFGLRKNDKNN